MPLSDDLYCRSIVLPVAFDDYGIFEPELCLRPTPTDIVIKRRGLPPIKGKRYGLSFGSRALLKDKEGAHAFGCANAAASNRRIASEHGGSVPDKKRRYYLGFYEARFGDVTNLQSQYFHIEFGWKPEVADEHFQLDFTDKASMMDEPPDLTAKQRKWTRQREVLALMAALWATMSGPSRSICGCDEADRAMLEEIPLPQAPLGSVA